MGRANKYNKDMGPRVIELMREGRSKTEVAAEMGLTRKTLQNWEKAHPEFLEAMREAEMLSQAWWERQGRENIDNKHFNTALFSINMQNRFRWNSRHKTDVTSGGESVAGPLIVVLDDGKDDGKGDGGSGDG